MLRFRELGELPILYSRAQPDDEFEPRPDPLDPYLIDQDEAQLDYEEDEEEEDSEG